MERTTLLLQRAGTLRARLLYSVHTACFSLLLKENEREP